MADTDDGFLSRWSRRKALAREGVALPEPPPPVPPLPAPAPLVPVVEAPPLAEPPAAPPPPPPPTLDDVATLTPEADFSRFVAPEVTPEVRNAALKKLFADPHYNVMDGLDIYIDDYGRPDPLPAGMLRQMVQSAALGLFADEPAAAPPPAAPSLTAPAPAPAAPPDHEDPDLRLQPDDAAGRPGPEPGAADEPERPR
ncbi:DUF3306 domain-containing protein [Ideonella sp. 4Y11]|uniref:DUF3306 domain-containing protein n=1 Tax=Ideonella aquatica TaxID=2824119 RepID=A0A940YCU1_9BURK|nr:DUF3306 domain-containing protein [Ideonella aquatica]MBQ0957815.1 DUF3306 domain-containing protein [Ideonella aquatica]